MVFVNELVASLIIAAVQGLTEWLPVSSSGHLVLFERILNFENGGLLFEVALHFGTLMAVFVYFGGDIIEILRALFSGKLDSENGRIGLMLVVATIPAALAGFFLKDIFGIAFGNLGIVALGFGITGIFLLIVNKGSFRISRSSENYGSFGYGKALLVGIAQIFSLFPGISRSGSTIGAGMLLGLDDKESVRFSFLMSIPVIFGANILTIGNNNLPPSLIWATLASFVMGLLTIHLLYGKMLASRKNLKWFGVYALLLALGLGIWLVWK